MELRMTTTSYFYSNEDVRYTDNKKRNQEINYRQMDDQICTPPLLLTLLLHKNNNGDDI